MFRSVGVQLFLSDLSNLTRSKTLRAPTGSLEELRRAAAGLLRSALPSAPRPVRRLGVRVSELSAASGQRDLTGYF